MDDPKSPPRAPQGGLKPFPATLLVPGALPKKRLAQYRERTTPRRIELSVPRLRAVSLQERQYVIFHEIGHWFRTEHVPLEIAGTEESFAHDFGLYFTAPGALKHEKPGRYAMVKLLIQKQEKKIRNFAQSMSMKIWKIDR